MNPYSRDTGEPRVWFHVESEDMRTRITKVYLVQSSQSSSFERSTTRIFSYSDMGEQNEVEKEGPAFSL